MLCPPVVPLASPNGVKEAALISSEMLLSLVLPAELAVFPEPGAVLEPGSVVVLPLPSVCGSCVALFEGIVVAPVESATVGSVAPSVA